MKFLKKWDVTIVTGVGCGAADLVLNIVKFYRDVNNDNNMNYLAQSNNNLLKENEELKNKISTLEEENTLLKDSSKGSTDLDINSDGSNDGGKYVY